MEIDDASTPPPSNMFSPSSNLPSANSSTGSLPASATPVNNTPNPQTSSTQPSAPGTPSTSKANQSSTSSGAPKRIPIPLPPNPRTRISLPPIPPPELHQFKGANPTHKEDGEIDDNAKTKPSSITIPTRAQLPNPRREWDKGLDSLHAPPHSLADSYRMPLKPSREMDPYRPSAAPPLLLSPGSLGRLDWMKQGGILPGPHSRDDFYDRRGSYFDDMQFPPERFERYPGRRRSSRSRSRSWSRSRSRERSPSPSWNLEGKMHGMAARRNRGLAERRNSGLEGEGTGWKRDLACLIINRDCLPFHRVSMENMKQEFDKFGPERIERHGENWYIRFVSLAQARKCHVVLNQKPLLGQHITNTPHEPGDGKLPPERLARKSTSAKELGQWRGSEAGRKPTTSIANSRIKTLSKEEALVRWASDIIMKELFQVFLKDLSTRIIGPTIHDFLNPATH
ncbi:MAG: hypothetical protein J3Q66DRAFT_162319 [Benniella sp.]|nr:MAG: hypothetical protein J3Q66DRAFT_162319 [Benniella sp.]